MLVVLSLLLAGTALPETTKARCDPKITNKELVMVDPIQLQPPPPPPPSRAKMNYVFAITSIALVGGGGVFAILYFRQDTDNTQMIIAWLGFLGSVLLQLVNLIKTADTAVKTDATHVLVNSQMAEQKKIIGELEYAKGLIEGLAQQREIEKAMKAENTLDREREQAADNIQALKDTRVPAAPVVPPPAPAAPAMILEAQPQNVELHVAGTGTFKDAEKELAEKHKKEEEKG